MSKARIIGAGTAGSTNYNTNVNMNIAGGTKKQGYPSAVGDYVNNRAINTRARGENNNIIFPMNQLQGGVHKPIRIYDGNAKFAPYDYYQPKAGAQEFLHFPIAQGTETWADGTNTFTIGATELVYNGNTTTWANVAAKISESRALFTPTDDFTLNVNNRVAMHSGGNITTVGQVTGAALGATLFDIRGAGYLSSIGHLILGSTSAKSTVVTYSSGTKGLQVNPLGAVAFNAAAAVSAGVVTLQDGAFGTAGQVLTSQGGTAPPTWTTPTGGSQNLASVLTAGNVADADQTIQLSRAAYSKRPYGTQTILNDSGGVFQIKSQLTSTPDESIAEFKVTDVNLSLIQNDTITGVIDEIDIQTTSIRVGKTDPTLNTVGMADTIDIYPSYLVVQQDRTGLPTKSTRFTANGIGIYDGNIFQYGTAGQILTSGGETGILTWEDGGATTLEEAITNGGGAANSSFQIQEAGTLNYSQMARDGFTSQNVTTFFPPFTTTTTSNLSPTSLVLTNLTNGITITATLEKDSLAYAVTGGSYEAEYTKDHMRVLDNGGQPKQTSIYPNQINLYDGTFAVGSRSLIIERNKIQIGTDTGTAGQVLGKDVGGNLAWTTPSTPTLQQVCDVGSTTDTGVTVQVGTVSAHLDEANLTFSGGATIASGSLAISAAGTNKDLSLDTTDGDISVTVKGLGRTFTVSAPILQINQGSGAAGEVLTYQADGSAEWAALPAPTLQAVTDASNVTTNELIVKSSATTYTTVDGDSVTFSNAAGDASLTNVAGTLQIEAPFTTISVPTVNGAEKYIPNLEFGDALLVYNDVGVVSGVSDGFAEVIFQNISPTAHSSNIIAICDKDGDHMALGQVSDTAVGSTLFDVRGAGYTSSSGHHILGPNSSTSADKSVVITYANGGAGLQVNPAGAVAFDASTAVSADVVSLQDGTFGDTGQVLTSQGGTAPPSWAWVTLPATPTLQQVCDVSSTTDTGITVQVGSVSSELDEASLTFSNAVYNTTYAYNEIETDASFTISSDDINIGTTVTAGSVITAGWYTNATEFSQTNFRGQVEFVDLCPHTSIEPTFGTDLTNKGYVDRVVGNYSGNGLTLYFNIPSANPNPITSVPISYDLGQTLTAVNATPSAAYYTLQSTALGLSHHIASFTTAAGFPNVTTIPVGLWSMLVYGFVSVQGGTLNYYFELWETDSAGVEIVQIGTSGDTSDVNATNALAPDAYHASLAITSPVSLASTSSRLRIKIYTRGTGMGGGVTLSTLFGGTYYSFITTSLSSSNALLTTNNTWTGTNNFGTGLFSTQTISAPATSSPVSLFLGQSAGGNITMGSAAADTTINGTSTKLYGKVSFNDQLFNGGDGGGSYTGLAYTIPADANRNTYFTLTVTGTNPTPPQAVVTLPVADVGGKFIHLFNAGTSVIRIDGSLSRRIFGGGGGTAGIVPYFLYVNQTLQLFSAGAQGFLVLSATTGNQGFGSPSVVATPSPNTQLLRNRITAFTGSPQTVTFVPNVYGTSIPSVIITPVGGTGVVLSSQTPAGFVFSYTSVPTALNWIAVW
jgi:hypothetical protein